MSLMDDALNCLAGALPKGSRIILFGSQARGDARPDSDLDLLVIEPAPDNRHAEAVRLATLLGRSLIPADVVVMGEQAFESQRLVPNTLAWRCAREGMVHELTD
jgi:predicted nucleotidyltransferase